MKTKIQFTDSYSGRAINIVINLTDGEKEYYLREDDKNVIYNKNRIILWEDKCILYQN